MAFVPSTSSSNVKICRKCHGTCPPCRPWRCKFSNGRTLEECEVDMQKSMTSLTLNQKNSKLIAFKNGYAKKVKREFSSLGNSVCGSQGILLSNEESCKITSEVSAVFQQHGSNDDSSSSSGAFARNTAFNSHAVSQKHKHIPFFRQLEDHETSHIFLSIAADPALVNYSKTVLSHVIPMPEVPEITSIHDVRCIWPHTIHLTIYHFGKVLNIDIPTIADYCKKNIEIIEPFHLHIKGMVHHEKLQAVGYAVEKETLEPLRQIKTNMAKWFKKIMCWESYTPIMSILRTHSRNGAKNPCVPLARDSIDTILQTFGGVQYAQEIIPERDIQLCIGSSSTETKFYKNILI